MKKLVKKGHFRLLHLIQTPQTVHCIGDSHLRVFESIQYATYFRHTVFKICMVVGATAMGIPNPMSKTKARRVFDNYLNKTPKRDSLLFLLGEVDCGFLIWFKNQETGEEIEELFKKSMTNYKLFLGETKRMRFEDILVCSVPLPTVISYSNYDKDNLRHKIKASFKDRTKITRRFNHSLMDVCKDLDMKFVDIERLSIDTKTNLVQKRFINPDKLDHHMNKDEFARIVVKALKLQGYN